MIRAESLAVVLLLVEGVGVLIAVPVIRSSVVHINLRLRWQGSDVAGGRCSSKSRKRNCALLALRYSVAGSVLLLALPQ